MKFFVDMALSPQLATWLGARGHDAVHAVAYGNPAGHAVSQWAKWLDFSWLAVLIPAGHAVDQWAM